jgi:hypothetical protein
MVSANQDNACGRSSMAERQLPKLHTRVRFPSPAPATSWSFALSARSRRNCGSAADSHPADPPAMAVPEALAHPFASRRVEIAGPIIVIARSRDARSNATLRACRCHGQRPSDRCDRDEGSKCLLHSRALLQMTPQRPVQHGKLLLAQTIACHQARKRLR